MAEFEYSLNQIFTSMLVNSLVLIHQSIQFKERTKKKAKDI